MFFTISPQPDTRLPYHEQIGNSILSHDSGWSGQDNQWFKGYQYPTIDHGNYAKITVVDDVICVDHDKCRSFPLWWNPDTKTLTSLLGTGESIWADDVVKIINGNIKLSKTDIYGPIDPSPIPQDRAIELLIDRFDQKFKLLAGHSLPKKLFVTGGVDTMTLLAFVKSQKIDCDVVDYEHFEFDQFTNANIQKLKQQHWAYAQIHHWRTPVMILTGGCGDEFFFRGPYTIALWSAWHDIDIVDILNKFDGYHKGYYLKDKNINIFKDFYNNREHIRELYKTEQDLTKQILNANVNDHQHWHLGNTLTWTPFKDLELTKIILRLNQDDLIKHILDADINKKIIQRVYPKCLELLSTTKNSNPREHLDKLYSI